eukprot:12850474-Alexandrium_andersonii.AAC.1
MRAVALRAREPWPRLGVQRHKAQQRGKPQRTAGSSFFCWFLQLPAILSGGGGAATFPSERLRRAPE